MDRVELIQKLIRAGGFERYLEIGCETGASFFPIRARRKIAVDPAFRIPRLAKARAVVKYPPNLLNRYFEEESDRFFAAHDDFLRRRGSLDVVFVDGLHTFRAALDDVLHSLRHLREDGVIVMHDCLPPHEAAALPTKGFPTAAEVAGVHGWNGQWCGDVWKAVVYLRRVCAASLDVHVLDCDFGLGVVTRRPGVPLGDLTIDEARFAEIDRMTYAEMLPQKTELLGLEPPAFGDVVAEQLRARLRGPAARLR